MRLQNLRLIIDTPIEQFDRKSLLETLEILEKFNRNIIDRLKIKHRQMRIVEVGDRYERLQTVLRLDHLNPQQRTFTEDILKKYKDLFFLDGDPYGRTDVIEHRIIVNSNKIINIRPRRMAPFLMEEANRQIKVLLDKGLLRTFEIAI